MSLIYIPKMFQMITFFNKKYNMSLPLAPNTASKYAAKLSLLFYIKWFLLKNNYKDKI